MIYFLIILIHVSMINGSMKLLPKSKHITLYNKSHSFHIYEIKVVSNEVF